ncbi:50S ribosomal protein L23 [Nitrosococcus watsonii]|uniref:Large ribosomal subunit protein uL23 n=1 Tax=Nitrosococcus watsoni (strain C-113) TaxID=105559 RepID=D8K7W1_NITWC|nr:50S ribosomal protein L23 [Nitrosococcus watsonii]ADJ28988.1 Ribosomal protein L25/L23 [Nitrosococcus watsonii C-113]
MNEEHLTKVILAPVVSEKSTLVGEKHNQVVFKVLPNADKREVKRAVELLFDVKVNKVHTALVKGKRKRSGRYIGRRSDWKKAYVVLQAGYEIDFVSVE